VKEFVTVEFFHRVNFLVHVKCGFIYRQIIQCPELFIRVLVFFFFFFFFFFVGLEFELRTLYHLSHTFNPFCSDYFGDGGGVS
jgi:hypothetical protein